jgi:peptidylprolyl isomerase
VATLPPEFTIAVTPALPFVRLADPDGFAPIVGFTAGFPVARDAAQRTTWLAHCYAMIGVGRDNAADSGGGTELYVVIGHAPRQLDRNITLAGRVVRGMEWLAALPRGTGAMGFLEAPQRGEEIRSIRVASELPDTERTPLEILRTDTPLFQQLIELRRNRRDEWYLEPAGHIDLCNVPLPARITPGPAAATRAP